MCEPAIHVLKSVFTKLVRQNAFASVATLRVVFFFCVSTIACFKGTDHNFCWSGKPIYHLQKQGNIHIFQNNQTNPYKFAEIMKKNRVFGNFHSWGHSNSVFNFQGGRKRLPKFKFSAKFPIGLHVILQIQMKKFENDCYLMWKIILTENPSRFNVEPLLK